jgi:4,4'-diaponeurosporenoate glycosyltransferase
MKLWQILELAVLLLPGFLILWRVRLCGERKDTSSTVDARSFPAFSVIIPARNEEARLPTLLESLRVQTVAPAEILVVDDNSTDATARLAREAGCRLIPAGEKPPGWLGKTWASWVGAQNAASGLLLFLDADTRLLPAGCERLLAERQSGGGVVTVQPWHQTGNAVEKLSSFFNVVVMAAINSFTAFGDGLDPAGCFGPCILCDREAYFRVDGHRTVKGSILEDLDLGRLFLSAGIPLRCRGGRGVIEFRMYPEGIAAQVEGWSKNMARGAQGAHPVVLACIALWITGCASAAFFGARGVLWGSLATAVEGVGFYVLYAGQLFWMYRRIGDFGLQSALLFPVHLLFFALVFLRSLALTFIVRRVSWKGRSIEGPVRARDRGSLRRR